jgi:hypothetical protein
MRSGLPTDVPPYFCTINATMFSMPDLKSERDSSATDQKKRGDEKPVASGG